MEPGTGLTILGSAIGSAKILEKILGPTSEYIGGQIKEWTQKKVENTAKIFKNAEHKLGDKINDVGTVPAKILKGIFEDGGWSEEELEVEYFGGVLASSRTHISRDDRGTYYITMISKMTTYQLRTHYLIYHLVKVLHDGKETNLNDAKNWRNLELFIPFHIFLEAMDFVESEEQEWVTLLSHSLFGLKKDELINDFKWGNKDFLREHFIEVNESGIVITPSKLGVELFLWAYGKGTLDPDLFLSKSLQFPNETSIKIGKPQAIKKLV